MMNLAPSPLQIAQIVKATEAEGPGRRFAIWLQGCPLRCAGCCNPEMLPFAGGTRAPLARLLEQIEHAAGEHRVEGVSLLGGEPFAHAQSAAPLAREVQARGLSVMIYSGYMLEEIRQLGSAAEELLAHTDLLVDGPYDREQPETVRRWIGSANQRVHFLTRRYDPDDPCWRLPNTLEIRMADGEVSVNGFPAKSAVGLWKRPRAVRHPLR